MFRSYRLARTFLQLTLHPKSLSKLLAASGASCGANAPLLSNLQLTVGRPADRLSLHLSALSKHGVATRSRWDVALLADCGEHALVEVSYMCAATSVGMVHRLYARVGLRAGRVQVAFGRKPASCVCKHRLPPPALPAPIYPCLHPTLTSWARWTPAPLSGHRSCSAACLASWLTW